MRLYGLYEIRSATIMHEEDALTDSPQWSRSELHPVGETLAYLIGETCSHVVNEEVRKGIHWHIREARPVEHTSDIDRGRVTHVAADLIEHLLAHLCGGGCGSSGETSAGDTA